MIAMITLVTVRISPPDQVAILASLTEVEGLCRTLPTRLRTFQTADSLYTLFKVPSFNRACGCMKSYVPTCSRVQPCATVCHRMSPYVTVCHLYPLPRRNGRTHLS